MLKTKVYIEISSAAPAVTEKKYGYILEAMQNGHPVTRAGFGSVTGTYHQATLKAMIEALKRYDRPSEIHLICANAFIINQIRTGCIGKWLKNGFVSSRGEPIANVKEWRRLACLAAQHQIVPEVEKQSSYSGWLQLEMRKEQKIE